MKLAYFSPLGPQPSGVADYSEELLPHLAAGAEITLFVEGFRPASDELLARFPVRDYRRDPSALLTLAEFDAVVYHMGNDHRYHAGIFAALRARPGIVVLHDFALQEFFLGLAREGDDPCLYLDEVEACHGTEARREASESLARGGTPSISARPLDFPLNCRIARSAEAIIVHSEWSRERIRRIAPGVPVRRINHHITRRAAGGLQPATRDAQGPVRIASFGFITPDKGIEPALSALARLRDRYDFRYVLVGQPNAYFDVRALVAKYGLEDRVEITGHVSLAEFERRINETDIAINLRERTVGETSGSLCRIMAAGVAAVVSDVGWFSELPPNAVVKVDAGEHCEALLGAYLERLIGDASLRAALGANARQYVTASHDIRRSAEDYLSFISEVIAARPRRRLLGGLSDQLAELGVCPECDEGFMRAVSSEVATLAPASLFTVAHAGAGNGKIPARARLTLPARSNGDESHADSETNAAQTPVPEAPTSHEQHNGGGGRLRKLDDIDYKRAAVEYLGKLPEGHRHYLRTKPFYSLANPPAKYQGERLDEETHRHFCDFANVALALALPAGSRILDVGCGSGWLSEYFARLGYEVKGIDISPALIEMSRERVARVPFGVDREADLRCTFEVHDIELAACAEKFDAVICYDSLHHFEDERAALRHLAAALDIGGQLFILEGVRPPAGSRGEEELRDVMREFQTLESPFDGDYLRALLDEHGLRIVGDYVSVNGLFERDLIEDDRLPLEKIATNYHYLVGKKVCDGAPASTVPDSLRPGLLRARLTPRSHPPERFAPGSTLTLALAVENEGDTLWLTGRTARPGVVMPALKVFDAAGILISEVHGEPLLPRAVAPGETVNIKIEYRVPRRAGAYTLKVDLVDQHVCWFEQQGSEPFTLSFEVV